MTSAFWTVMLTTAVDKMCKALDIIRLAGARQRHLL